MTGNPFRGMVQGCTYGTDLRRDRICRLGKPLPVSFLTGLSSAGCVFFLSSEFAVWRSEVHLIMPGFSVRIYLKPKRERSLIRRHPWIFSGAVARIEGEPGAGETVGIYSSAGEFLAWGSYSPASSICARVWSFEMESPVDSALLEARIRDAVALRERLGLMDTAGACRLVYSEADGLPGLIVDRYGEYLVCQFLGCGAEARRGEILEILQRILVPRGVYERSDAEARERDGLPRQCGNLAGEELPPEVEIREHGLRFLVDVRTGHKTGFYLDQRDNRLLVRSCTAGKEVLNCFSYTGGFSLNALAGDAASVTDVDSSAAVLQASHAQVKLNGLPEDRHETAAADVFAYLRHCRDSRREFDVIILDPPKFAEARGQVERACRGYKDINLLALKLLRPGGMLFTFSCSGAIDPNLFRKVVADACVDAGRSALVIRSLGQAPDHPVPLTFPEALYLKGLQIIV